MTRLAFIAQSLTCIGLIGVGLLSIRDRGGKVSAATLIFLVALVLWLIGGIALAYWRAWHA